MTGCFPAKLKVAKVIPVFKNYDKHLVTNYRSISVLPFFLRFWKKMCSKLLDSLNCLNNNDMLTINQFRFRKKHTMYMAILGLFDKISHQIDGKILYWYIY